MWMDGWLAGWMDGWMDGGMDGWMESCIEISGRDRRETGMGVLKDESPSSSNDLPGLRHSDPV
jgi:hypothetical protein